MENLGVWVMILIIVLTFMLPTIVAFSNRHPYKWAILVANLVIAPAMYPWLAILLAAMYRRPYRR